MVTDHALVRWLERVYGIDMDQVRQRLAEQCAPYVEVKALYAPLGDGFYAVISQGRITTVVEGKPNTRDIRQMHLQKGPRSAATVTD